MRPTARARLRRARRVAGQVRHRAHRDAMYPLLRHVPLHDDLVVFQSWQGKQYSDNPRALSEELSRRRPDLRCVWVLRSRPVDVPDGVEVVRQWSRQYYETLARARWLVTNDLLDRRFVKRRGSTLVQTWHGTPLKRLGFDIATLRSRDTTYLDLLARQVQGWDFLVSPNPHSTEVFRRAFRYDGTVLETGYPRNDLLLSADREAVAGRLRSTLGIGPDRRVVLWLPTWRDHLHAPDSYQFPLALDVDAFARALGEDHVLLVRGHHHTAPNVPDLCRAGVRDVTGFPDVRELLLLADVLLTDYSSAMFDFAVTGRPLLFFAWDLEAYRDEVRGFTFDLELQAPGPVLRSTGDVIAALRDLDAVSRAYAGRYADWRTRFCALEDGHASGRVLDAVFAR